MQTVCFICLPLSYSPESAKSNGKESGEKSRILKYFQFSKTVSRLKKYILHPRLLCYNFKGCWLLTENRAGSE